MADKQSYDGQAALEKDEEGSDGVGIAQMLRKSCFGKRWEEVTLFWIREVKEYNFILVPWGAGKATALGSGVLGMKSAVSH